MNLGIRWAVKDPAGGSFKSRKRRLHLSAAFEGAFEMGQPLTLRSDAIALRMHPSKDASPELGHSHKHARRYGDRLAAPDTS